jgi:Fe2+ or Zn2+ uptake regulation protein
MQNTKEIYKILAFTKKDILIWEIIEFPLSLAEIYEETQKRKNKIPRTTIFEIIKRFKKRDLLIIKQRGKRKLYVQNTELSFFKDKEIPFGQISKVKIHTGLVEIIKTWENLKTIKGHRWYLYQTRENINFFIQKSKVINKDKNEIENIKYISEMNNKVRENQQITELFIDCTPEEYIENMKSKLTDIEFINWIKSINRKYITYIVPRNLFYSNYDIFTLYDSLYLTNYQKEICIEIKHQPVVDLAKNLLNALKQNSPQVDFNKILQNYIS